MKKCLYLLPKLMPQEPGQIYRGGEPQAFCLRLARIKLMRKMALGKGIFPDGEGKGVFAAACFCGDRNRRGRRSLRGGNCHV